TYPPEKWLFRYIGTTPMTRPAGSAKDKCCGAQPLRAVQDPLSSSAFRKTCDTVGLTSPAQASQASGAISLIAGWMRRVIVSPVSFMGLAPGAQPSSKFASPSPATPPGKALVPTAAHACFPASPNTSTIK